MEDMICPKCGSSSTYKSKKFKAWICEDCGEKFTETVTVSNRWNDGLDAVDYWNDEFVSVAPVSLAVAYQKLKEYVTGIDPDAFVILQEAHQVLGDGFARYSADQL